MILKCNVCKNGSRINLDFKPNHYNDLVCCHNCDKQMAYADWNERGTKLIWYPIDTQFSPEHGFIPVEIIKN